MAGMKLHFSSTVAFLFFVDNFYVGYIF